MVKAADFEGDKVRRWFLENKWRVDIEAYGRLQRGYEKAQTRWERAELAVQSSKVLHALYTKAAALELQAELSQ